MKKLIINADDFGLCDSVNEGILECFQQGLVSDFSFMINLEEFHRSVKLLKNNNISEVGIHLNLTVGKSVLGNATNLTKNDGSFLLLKDVLLGMAKGQIGRKDFYREIKAQLNLLLEQGFTVTHIDSHRNVHLLPPIMSVIQNIMKELGLDVPVRMPDERYYHLGNFTFENFKRLFILNLMEMICRFQVNYKPGIKTVGGNFFNHPHPEVVFRDVIQYIRKSPHNSFEMAVHPGYPSQKIKIYDSYVESRLVELKFLKNSNYNLDGLTIINFKEYNNS